MTDPQLLFDFDSNVTFSDTTDTNLSSPAISISSTPNGRPTTETTIISGHHNSQGSGLKATNQASTTINSNPSQYSTIPRSDAETADAANPSPDTRQAFLPKDLEYPTVTVRVQDTEAQQAQLGSSTDAAHTASYNLVAPSFGSQPWIAPPGPFLAFAPQPIYEPTGELLHETVQSFDEFHDRSFPSLVVTSTASPSNPAPNTTQPAEAASNTNGSYSVTPFVQPSLPRSALKRKASSSVTTPTGYSAERKTRLSGVGPDPALGRDSPPIHNRSVTFERMSGIGPTSPDDGSTSSDFLANSRSALNAGIPAGNRRTRQSSGSTPRPPLGVPSTSSQGSQRRVGNRTSSAHPPSILPPEKVFPIQIGSDLFRLSGASISSDAPSYFTQFFEEQIRQNEESGGVRTLYIDRDPATFRDVARHLQGYYVKPVDGSHFVKLFADAQFYSLPRLIDQLFESEIFIQIGERHFQIPKDIFSEPGNSPNFFSLGFAVFFSTPGEVFPGLDRRGLLRPPSITPPYVPGRSADIFAQLLHLLRGYPLSITSESHRAELLRDCRYFHLRGLEQKIIAHEISYNLERQKQEICLRLEDVKPSGVSFTSNDPVESGKPTTGGWVYYARPFVDDTSYEMVVEVGSECTILDLTDMRADFHNLAKARISSLFQVVANKMNLPTNAPLGLVMLSGGRSSQSASPGQTPLSEDRVKVRFEAASDITLDGKPYEIDWDSALGKVFLNGPSTAASDSESDSDAMSEDTDTKPGPSAISQQRRPQTRHTPGGPSGQSAAGPRGNLPVPPIQTSRISPAAPSKKKRKRQNSQGELGEWIIRTGQWRLRVQPNTQDTIRGGFEIVFIGVKIDAYSSERARNARRGFLN